MQDVLGASLMRRQLLGAVSRRGLLRIAWAPEPHASGPLAFSSGTFGQETLRPRPSKRRRRSSP
eukprot:15481041-Alexandrium_andersonii.AAC.1